MPSPELIRRVTAIGLFLLPVGLVKLTGLYLGQVGPSTAQAAENDPSAPPTANSIVKAPTWTDRQIKASQYVAKLHSTACPPTPFLYEVNDAATGNPTVANDPVPATATSGDASKFTAQAILASSSGTTALINGKPYRTGDTIRDSTWMVQAIDAESRSVTLRDTISGRMATVAVEMPTLRK